MRKSLERLTQQALTAMYAVEIAEDRHGKNHKWTLKAEHKYRKALEELGVKMNSTVGYPIKRIGPRPVEVEKLRKAG